MPPASLPNDVTYHGDTFLPGASAPLVSVIVPVYRRLDLLDVALDSVAAQTFTNWELIIVDDGSECGAKIMQRLPEKACVLERAHRGGCGAARNSGMRICRGKYVAFLDSDDVWLPSKLETQVRLLDAHPEAAFVYSQVRLVDNDLVPLARQPECIHPGGDPFKRILGRFTVYSPTIVMARTAAVVAVGLFNEVLPRSEDWDMWLHLTQQWGMVCDPQVQALYRIHPQQKTTNRLAMRDAERQILEEWIPRLPADRPDLLQVAQHRLARCLQKLARSQASAGLGRDVAFATLRRSLQLNPWNAQAWLRYPQLAVIGALAAPPVPMSQETWDTGVES